MTNQKQPRRDLKTVSTSHSTQKTAHGKRPNGQQSFDGELQEKRAAVQLARTSSAAEISRQEQSSETDISDDSYDDSSESSSTCDDSSVSFSSVDNGEYLPAQPEIDTEEEVETDEGLDSDSRVQEQTLEIDLPSENERIKFGTTLCAILNTHPNYERLGKRLPKTVLQRFFLEQDVPTVGGLVGVLNDMERPEIPLKELSKLWRALPSYVGTKLESGNQGIDDHCGDATERKASACEQAVRTSTASDETSPESEVSRPSQSITIRGLGNKRRDSSSSLDMYDATPEPHASKRRKLASSHSGSASSRRGSSTSDRTINDQEVPRSSTKIQQIEVKMVAILYDEDGVPTERRMGDPIKISTRCRNCNSAAALVIGERGGDAEGQTAGDLGWNDLGTA